MNIQKLLRVGAITLSILVVLLVVHIYWVTRPPKADVNNIAMARIDFKTALNQQQGASITAWLYAQKGVTHVLCNTQTNIAVFTFYPAQVNATQLTAKLSKELGLPANRYLPSNDELASGCPVLPNLAQKKLIQIAQSVF
ncbi:MAG: hypothetical protein KGK14_03650 [Bacteroidota bacterium]|nr:hypothetical protein [Bacteroidota bacterium]